eukprot:TRINITY_DN3585_c0_g1_i1.p2 TRINITY_DN3585_c0_g1~~TRINITY_DN3585_c0_g1_i1.p2  ORF type:complete len:272 (-),score=27.36 TRINITY_DN3585_c0_g1_i1:1039-1854(-)
MVDIWTNIYIKTVGAIELLDNAFHKMMNKITHNTVEKQQKSLFNPDLSNLQDKVVIITGGNAGIGKATAKFLVEHGAHVIIACRSLTRGENAVKDIQKSINQNLTDKTWYNEVEHKIQDDGIAGVTNGNIANKNVQNFGQIEVQQLDLCSYNSIQKFVKDFKGDFDILICNAGIMVPPKRILSENNLEAQFQTNYLGHWLLTNLLLQKNPKSKRPNTKQTNCDVKFDDSQSWKFEHRKRRFFRIKRLRTVCLLRQIKTSGRFGSERIPASI